MVPRVLLKFLLSFPLMTNSLIISGLSHELADTHGTARRRAYFNLLSSNRQCTCLPVLVNDGRSKCFSKHFQHALIITDLLNTFWKSIVHRIEAWRIGTPLLDDSHSTSSPGSSIICLLVDLLGSTSRGRSQSLHSNRFEIDIPRPFIIAGQSLITIRCAVVPTEYLRIRFAGH